jgi:uncharacterized protein (DUF433 family)
MMICFWGCTMNDTVLTLNYIVSNPKIRGGLPIIEGTTIRVSDVAALSEYKGYSVEEIAVNYTLSLSQVYAALTYYHAHKSDIDAELKADDDFIQNMKAKRLGNSLLP